jgi:hypothetical protein
MIVPADDHVGVPGTALYPDVADDESQIRCHPAQALEPSAQGFFVVMSAAEGVAAAEAMVDVRRARGE